MAYTQGFVTAALDTPGLRDSWMDGLGCMTLTRGLKGGGRRLGILGNTTIMAFGGSLVEFGDTLQVLLVRKTRKTN